ncbi:MAG TPA: hypothetical protein VMV46_16835 [Thermoanaerobaculia bacterium]|nr:hypothetical protein [Thermoanaerobaculia bacterium]
MRPLDADAEGPEEALDDEPFSNRLLDQVVPEELDWIGLVRRYPLAALAVAAAAGFYVGRVHGDRLIEAAADVADRRMKETADRLVAAAQGEVEAVR